MCSSTPAYSPTNRSGRRKQSVTRTRRRVDNPLPAILAAFMASLVAVLCKDDLHIMTSVARGDELIKVTTHSADVLWVKIPEAHLSMDSPCITQDCYAVCATLPTVVRELFEPSVRCWAGWAQPTGLGGHPGPRDNARPSRR